MKSISNLTKSLIVSIPIFSISICLFSYDVGGGSGIPISPYKQRHISENSENAEVLRKESASHKVINCSSVNGEQIYGQDIGFAYIQSGQPIKEIQYALIGTPLNSISPSEYDLSCITSFKIIKLENHEATIQLDLFPAITTDELFKIQPSYSDLKTKFTDSITITISTRNKVKASLVIVGKVGGTSSQNKIISNIELLPLNQKIELYGGKIFWWAITSVIKDPAYPYREIFKK